MAQALRNATTQNFVQKTLGASLLTGVTAAATLNNVTSIQNLPGVMIVDRVDSNGVETPTKREVIQYAATSGVTVTTLTRNADGSGTDQDHAVGAIVEFGPDILWAQSVIDGLTQVVVAATGLLDTTKVVDLTTAQTLTNKTLTSPVINTPTGDVATKTGTETLTNKTLTSPVINGSVTGTASNRLGYAQVTAGQSGITTATDLTGLTITVTVPAGGRDVQIFAQLPLVYSTTTGDRVNLSIKEGSTTLALIYQSIDGTLGNFISMTAYLVAPTAGSHTYKLTLTRDTGTGSETLYADATALAFISAVLI